MPYVFAMPFFAGGLIILANPPDKNYSGSSDNNDLKLLFALFLLVGSMSVAITWSIVSTVRYRNFCRKLTAALNRYQAEGKIAARISRSTLFRISLRGEPRSFPWERQPQPAPGAINSFHR